MFFKFPHIYLKIKTNKVWAKHLESQTVVELVAQKPFTTERLLVGNIDTALLTVKAAMLQVHSVKWFSFSNVPPNVVIQPLEYLDGGLSPVEKRIFFDLAMLTGARDVRVWEGKELIDMEVVELFR